MSLSVLGLLVSFGNVVVGLVTVFHLIVCVFLIGVVLLQSGRAADLSSAFGAGGGSQANIAAMSSENILSKATKFSAFAFMVTSLTLAIFAHGESRSVLDEVGDDAAPAAATETPGGEGEDVEAAVPVVPSEDLDVTVEPAEATEPAPGAEPAAGADLPEEQPLQAPGREETGPDDGP